MTEWGYEVSSESLDNFIALDGAINPEVDQPCLVPACITEQAWLGMRGRCSSNPYYTGKGIGVCQEWAQDFDAFLRDVGHRPSQDYCLHRIDNEKGYELGNVAWVTRSEHSKLHNAARRMLKEGVIS